MNFLSWIIIGGIAGWLAGKVIRGGGLGVLKNIVVGVLGGVLGGWIMSLIGGEGVTGFNLYTLLVAFVGSCVLLWLLNLLGDKK